MVNDSERILSTFSKLYFFKELVHDNLHFTLDISYWGQARWSD